MSNPGMRRLAMTQAAYYAATGVWPLLDIESFERVTGPKTDRWLVRTVGALVTVIGASLSLAARDDPARGETVVVAAGSALALGTIDAVYVAKRRISPIYLVDALAQAALLVVWIHNRKGLGRFAPAPKTRLSAQAPKRPGLIALVHGE